MNTIKFPAELIDAISVLEPQTRCEIYDTVIQYIKSGEMPKNISPVAQAIISLARPSIDRANRKPKPKAESPTAKTPIPKEFMTRYLDPYFDHETKMRFNSLGIETKNFKKLYISATNAGVLDLLHKNSFELWEDRIMDTLLDFIGDCMLKRISPLHFADHPDEDFKRITASIVNKS